MISENESGRNVDGRDSGPFSVLFLQLLEGTDKNDVKCHDVFLTSKS